MRSMRILLGLTAFCMLAVSPTSVLLQKSESQKIDLNGKWIDDGREVLITTTGNSVTATYKEAYICNPRNGSPAQQTKEDFTATLNGNKLIGKTSVCSYGKGNSCRNGIQKASITLTVTEDGQQMKGSYYNCNNKADVSVLLTRVCSPDKKELCADLAKASKSASDAISAPASSYQAFQQTLSDQLGQLRNELCDNKDAQRKIDALIEALTSVNGGGSRLDQYQNLARIESELKSAAAASCGGNTGPGEGGCSPGEKKKAPGDDEAAKFVWDKVKEAIKTLEEEKKELDGPGSAIKQRIAEINGKIEKLKKLKGYYDQIIAASCLPADVIQTMRQVANDRRAQGYSNNCPAMCNALTAWYEKLIGQDHSLQGKIFMETCLADCN